MYDEIPGNKHLIRRIITLEAENKKLQEESSRYLRNWIAALDLASWRQVMMLCQKPPTGDAGDKVTDDAGQNTVSEAEDTVPRDSVG